LRLLDCKNASCRQIAGAAPKTYTHLCPECAAHFDQLQKYLFLLALPFEVDSCLVRGLDYYTRTVFEIQPEDEGSQSSLGGGGRYDDLIEELGGKPTPGIGFAAGIERIITNLKRQNASVPPLFGPEVFIAFLGDAARDAAVKLAGDLRRSGISLTQAQGQKSLMAQLRQANNLGVRQTIIIGEEEVKTGTAQLRDMSTSQQQTVLLDNLAEKLK